VAVVYLIESVYNAGRKQTTHVRARKASVNKNTSVLSADFGLIFDVFLFRQKIINLSLLIAVGRYCNSQNFER